jgi:hypothetical protein
MDAHKKLSEAEKLSHFRNLVIMAMKDGKIADEERDMLAFLAEKWGLSSDQAGQVLTSPESVQLALPEDPNLRFQQLYDLTEMMIIDGVMGAQEKQLCIEFAQGLGFGAPTIAIIVEEILEGNRLLRSEEAIQAAIRLRMQAE